MLVSNRPPVTPPQKDRLLRLPLIGHAQCTEATLGQMETLLTPLVQEPCVRGLAEGEPDGHGCMANLFSGHANLTYVAFGQPVTVEFWNQDLFGCAIPLQGRARLEQYPCTVQGRNGPFFMLPKSDQQWQLSADCRMLVFRFDVETEGARDRLADMFRKGDGHGLADCAQVLMESIPYRLNHGLGFSGKLTLQEQIRCEFLRLFGIGSDQHAQPADPEVMDPRVLRAMDYLLQLPASEYHLDDICDVAHMSARGLYYAFARNLGCTPYAYFRACHLIRVRLSILADTGREHSIAWHASTHGFQHMSRFAAHYRNHFGELPSETCPYV